MRIAIAGFVAVVPVQPGTACPPPLLSIIAGVARYSHSPIAGDAPAQRWRQTVTVSDLAIVAVVASRTEAELIVGMLGSHGLHAVLSADDAGGQYPQQLDDGVRVLVARSDEASARRLLAAAE